MIHDIPKPQISPEFTLDDIHRIREWNYERLKDATVSEWIADINHSAETFKERLTELKIKWEKS
jgi:hypothetical protein